MRGPLSSVKKLEEFGRIRLSDTLFMRDFLFSEISAIHGVANLPDDLELAQQAGEHLCQELLEPLQNAFGRLAIRSSYRSCAINQLGNEKGLSCAANERNYAHHIWDKRDSHGRMGAMACVIVPSFWDRFQVEGDWRKLGWWIHDHLPYSSLYFFPKRNLWACNLGWREQPERKIDSYAWPKGTLSKPGMANHLGSHRAEWEGILPE